VTLRSAASTMPSLARMPIAVPAWEIASSAYSTWYRRPSGEKMVVCADGKLHGRSSSLGSSGSRVLVEPKGTPTHSGIVSSRHCSWRSIESDGG
jgi:hypothetical protein